MPAAADGTVRETADSYILTVCGTAATVSKRSGTIVSFMRNGRELLAEPMQLNAFRAPLDNDCKIRDNWKKSFADRLVPKIYKIQSDGSRVICHLAMGYAAYEPLYRAEIVYAPYAGGITVTIHAEVNEKLQYLPRFGIRLFMRRGIWSSWIIWATGRRKTTSTSITASSSAGISPRWMSSIPAASIRRRADRTLAATGSRCTAGAIA